MDLARVLAHLEAGHERILGELKEFAAIPSVSTDPAHAAAMREAAQWIAAKLEAAGPFTVRTMPTPGASVVYAEWLGAPGKPTLLFYGHYDVQPPDPLDEWHSPPFEPPIRGENIFARGAVDDKGQTYLILKAGAEAIFQVTLTGTSDRDAETVIARANAICQTRGSSGRRSVDGDEQHGCQ